MSLANDISTLGFSNLQNEVQGSGPTTINNNITIVSNGAACPITVGTANTDFVCGRIPADTEDRLALQPSGILIGNGSSPPTKIIQISGGDLLISSPSSTIDFDNKVISDIQAAVMGTLNSTQIVNSNTTINGTFGVQLDSNGAIRIGDGSSTIQNVILNSPAASTLRINDGSLTTLGTIQVGTVSTNAGDLSINPAGGNVAFNNKTLTNVREVQFSGGLANTAKATTFITGDSQPRISINTDAILLGNGSSPGDTYLTGDLGSILRVGSSATNSSGNLRVSTISTDSGDLVLNPAGINVNFSGKNIINAVLPPSSLSYPLTYNTSGSIANYLETRLSSDTQLRWEVENDGKVYWGSGSSAPDVFLDRQNSTTLRLSSLSGGTGRGNFTLNTVNANAMDGNTFGYVNIQSSGSTDGGADNTAISCTGANFGGSSGNNNTAISCGTVSFGSGDNNCIIASDSSASTGSGNRSVVAACIGGGTISSSSGANMMVCSGNGNSTISGTAGGTFAFGSYVSTSQANCFLLSDSTATPISCGSNKTFYGRFTGTGGYYLTVNAAASSGLQLTAANPGSWVSISDERLKNVERDIPMQDIYQDIDDVRIVNYRFKDDEEGDPIKLGMLAQQVNNLYEKHHLGEKRISPSHPMTTKDDPIQTVSSAEIAYLSFGLIKHQKKLIESLTNDNIDLKARISKLESRLDKLATILNV